MVSDTADAAKLAGVRLSERAGFVIDAVDRREGGVSRLVVV